MESVGWRCVSAAVFSLALAGCADVPDIVGIVKAGRLPAHTTKTVGKAFDDAFPSGLWTSDMSGMGEMFAHFRATTTAEALEAGGVSGIGRAKCIDGVRSPCRIPVWFQFALSSDNRSVELVYVEAPDTIGPGARRDALLAFVYR